MPWSKCHAMQNAEGFRKRALEGIKVITYLQEFANVGSLSELPELFRDDNRLAEAAVRPCLDSPFSDECHRQSDAPVNEWRSFGTPSSELCGDRGRPHAGSHPANHGHRAGADVRQRARRAARRRPKEQRDHCAVTGEQQTP